MGDQKERKKDYPCLKCNMHVKKNEPAVLCNMCELWVHKVCAKISDDLFDHLVKQQKNEGRVYWACVSCTSFSSKFYSGLRKIEGRVSAVEAKLDEHDSAIDAVNEKVKILEQNCLKANDEIAKVESGVHDKASDVIFTEMRERESRMCNAIVHGLQEPDLQIKDKDIRIANDMKKIQNLFDEMEADIKADDEVKFARRLGERPSSTAEPRPLLIGFKICSTRNDLLKNARKLADNDVEEWKKVSVVADLTKRQREEENKMRKEAESLNSNRSVDEIKNWEWKVVGRRGDRHLVKMKLQLDTGARKLRSQTKKK